MAEFLAQKEFEERIIQIKRVSKKTKGGNKIGFTALVVVGDKKGRVGIGLGKAGDVSLAIQKSVSAAKDDMVKIPLKGNTIPHEVRKKYKASEMILKPAPEGSGIIAGGSVRQVLELAGIRDISAKLLRSRNKLCNVRCTILALQDLKG